MLRALVLGANGQDGTYLTRNLLRRGFEVFGAGRDCESRHVVAQDHFQYLPIDFADAGAVSAMLPDVRPDLIFHVAAVHGASGFSYEPVWGAALQVNTASVYEVLEYLRNTNQDARLVYASSAKVFGLELPAEIDEDSPMSSTCLYSITKNATRELVDHYRRKHGAKASLLFLFNHESELRGSVFFIPRVVEALKQALAGSPDVLEVQTLSFQCDWGLADEYMDIAIDVAEKAIGQDFVLATGHTLTGREFVRELFSRYGLDYRQFVREKLSGIILQKQFSVKLKKLEFAIGRRPTRSIYELCHQMIDTSFTDQSLARNK